MIEPRKPFNGLSDAEIDDIAERAAERALEKVYLEVGRSIVRRLFWLVGVLALSVLIVLAGKGVINPRDFS